MPQPTQQPAPPANCWCGRTPSTLPGGDGTHCAEHDLPVSTPRRTR